MMIVLLLSLGDCTGGGVPRPLRHELVGHASRTQRSRRSIEQPPIQSMHINMTYLTDEHAYGVGLAYKFFAMVYSGQGIDIHVQGSPEEPLAETGVLLGTANEDTNTITLYTKHIPNVDAIVLVTIHEMFHLFGFSTAREENALSFADRANAFTLDYNSSLMQQCTGKRVHVHRDARHWNYSDAYFNDDTMLAYIDFGKTATTPCTVQAVLESRPSWSHHLCSSDAACSNGNVCRLIGRHWIRVCHAPEVVVHPEFEPENVITNMLAYAFAVWILAISATYPRGGKM